MRIKVTNKKGNKNYLSPFIEGITKPGHLPQLASPLLGFEYLQDMVKVQ